MREPKSFMTASGCPRKVSPLGAFCHSNNIGCFTVLIETASMGDATLYSHGIVVNL